MSMVVKMLLLLLFFVSYSNAADQYVLDGGTSSTCSSWEDACDSLATAESRVTRGDTIWVGDGTYGACTFNVSESGSTYIYVKKATASAHGTETGWSATYGDGQAVFTINGQVWDFETGYWDIDGVTGSGTSGHGFEIIHTGTSGGHGIEIDASYILLRHIEISQPNYASSTTATDLINIGTSGSGGLIQYCYLRDVHRDFITAGGGSNSWVVEYNYMTNNHSNCNIEAHGQPIYIGYSSGSDDWTIRYNTIVNANGSAIVFLSGDCDNVLIYGNVIYENHSSVDCGEFSVGSIIGVNNTNGQPDSVIYNNNTAVGLDGRVGSGNIGNSDLSSATGCSAYNNIWYGCNLTAWTGFTSTHDYNASDDDLGEAHDQTISSSIFTNYAGGDFTLSVPTNAGTPLASPYDQDCLDGSCTTRGADGTWDRGAYEFTAGTSISGVGSISGITLQ